MDEYDPRDWLTLGNTFALIAFMAIQYVWLNKQLGENQNRQGRILMALKELLDNISGWGKSWRDQAKAATAVAEAEKTRADNATQALTDALASDAVTDKEQIDAAVAAAVGSDEAMAAETWAQLQALDAPAEEPPTTDPETGEAPVEPTEGE